ncbi:MAG: hypothetical protein H6Q25_1675 [Bacteroidetes bacterium]|nr:hypothetical protein [Bacteroidota bacterium]
MKNKNPFVPFLILASYVFAIICYLGVSQYISETQGPIVPPEWITLARSIVYLIFICCFACSFLMERYIQTKSAEKIVKQGKDPDLIILIYGLGLFLLPTCMMFFIFFKSGIINDIYICSILSFIGFVYWSWHKRNVFTLNRQVESQEHTTELSQLSESSNILFVRSYTVMLCLLSIIYAGFLVLKIFLIINPPKFRTMHSSSLEMVTVSIYAFLAICCLATAILRFRKSSYALFATKVTSFLLCVWIPFGTAACSG